MVYSRQKTRYPSMTGCSPSRHHWKTTKFNVDEGCPKTFCLKIFFFFFKIKSNQSRVIQPVRQFQFNKIREIENNSPRKIGTCKIYTHKDFGEAGTLIAMSEAATEFDSLLIEAKELIKFFFGVTPTGPLFKINSELMNYYILQKPSKL